MSLAPHEIAKYVKTSIEPLTDFIYGNRYRCAAYLLDDTYLPCVIVQSKTAELNLFLRRTKELRWRPSQKNRVIESFVTGGSCVASSDLQRLEPSPFAWPLSLLKQIHGETTMGWTAFVAEMHDGSLWPYGTDFRMEFFDLPAGYSYDDIGKIHRGMSYTPDAGLQPFNFDTLNVAPPLREKPFFKCYVDGLS